MYIYIYVYIMQTIKSEGKLDLLRVPFAKLTIELLVLCPSLFSVKFYTFYVLISKKWHKIFKTVKKISMQSAREIPIDKWYV